VSALHVVHVAAEASPYAKTGGLGDVVGALPAALARSGVEVTVVIPGYRAAREVAGSTRRLGTVSALVSSRREEANVDAVDGAPVPTLLIDAPRYFDRPELYGEGGRDYLDNAERFVVFCRATLEWLRHATPPPDVVHVHDWQAALVPVFVADRMRYPELGGAHTVVTVHNLDDRPHEVVLDLHREAVKELHSPLDGDDLASPTARHHVHLAPHGHRGYRGA